MEDTLEASDQFVASLRGKVASLAEACRRDLGVCTDAVTGQQMKDTMKACEELLVRLEEVQKTSIGGGSGGQAQNKALLEPILAFWDTWSKHRKGED